ncbi:hypothetical protein SAMN05421641_1376 [Paracoccus thiocyanatus]|uniref:Uncharacterized protein n=1 Tax=Paracoccus thiocyanatus TaxID=34006 RepID=A0A1N6ZPY8_9RHOB|nr:hypothetical protein [Paracoccus thiocyanatus]SIR28781.1 hypothetical protein SAMN05421641_1376 [Paracoccus thiocyanatus]
MVPFLRLLLIHLWVGSISGVVVIAGLTMGYVSAWTFIWAALIGLALGIPAALLNWTYLRPHRSRQIGWSWAIADRARAGFGWAPGTPRSRAAITGR